MYIGADSKGGLITVAGDPRITRVGKIIRKYKLDEFPQLLNVFKGDMSLVGPRPEVKKYVDLFWDDFKDILKVKPGITDFASVEFRNEEEILKKYQDPEKAYIQEVLPQKIKLYKKYINEMSFTTDLKLIFLTLWRVLKHD